MYIYIYISKQTWSIRASVYNMTIYKKWFCAVGVTCRHLGLLTRFACMSKNNFNKLKHICEPFEPFSKPSHLLFQARRVRDVRFHFRGTFADSYFFGSSFDKAFAKTNFRIFLHIQLGDQCGFGFRGCNMFYFNTSSHYHLGFWKLLILDNMK